MGDDEHGTAGAAGTIPVRCARMKRGDLAVCGTCGVTGPSFLAGEAICRPCYSRRWDRRVGPKPCLECGKPSPMEPFRMAICSEDCRRARRKVSSQRYRAKEPQKRAILNRTGKLRSYSLTPERYEAMFQRQGGRCAICDQPERKPNTALTVDHDHACCPTKQSCGKCIRGLLCSRCNIAIGLLGDHNVPRAAGYLFACREPDWYDETDSERRAGTMRATSGDVG